MIRLPDDLQRTLHEQGQEHILESWDSWSEPACLDLIENLRGIDLALLLKLHRESKQHLALPSFEGIEPIEAVRLGADDPQLRSQGEQALSQGEVGVLVVAGGQGSRLGFEHPKGMYPIGPVSNKSLFQLHAEKILALSRRYGKPLPFLVMTSPGNHAETQTYFAEHGYFGLPAEEVFFFSQGTMPALDLETGRLLFEAPGQLFTSPNGHGGSLTALAESGLLDQMRQRGIRHIFYFQVDNPLVKIADPDFIGHHVAVQSEASTKVLAKNGPEDKMGNLVSIDGKCCIIEYTDLPRELGRQTDAAGKLRFWAGNPAIHIFGVEFLARVTQGESRIPFHLARKKVPCLDANGMKFEPTTENALKFEMFIFDVLPRADRWAVVETSRREEFEPLKNATGSDSPQSVRQALTNLAADWLGRAGAIVARQPDGNAAVPLEISSLFALDAAELAAKIPRGLAITEPTYFA